MLRSRSSRPCRSSLWLALVVIATAPLLGAADCLGGQSCTLEARASLVVTAQTATGAAVDDATITASANGGPEEPCDLAPGAAGTGNYLCPFFEVEGDFTVTARKGSFEETKQATVGRTEDGCHVEAAVVAFTVPDDTGCCCAFIRPGDFDIISEEPTATIAACLALDQGECVDSATVAARLTPHPCCPDATGARCGG